MVYTARVVDAELTRRLAAVGAVLVEGPKSCGKTETALQIASSVVRLDVDARARAVAELDPSLLLDGAAPRLIDEWQLEPRLWNHVRRAVDDRQKPGQFILTGSSVPSDDVSRHSGAGRFSTLRMRPMSLFESGHSTGEISLAALMRSDEPRSPESPLDLRGIAERITVGGWPAQQHASASEGAQAARDYLEQIRHVDVARLEGVRRDPARVGRLLAALARNVATAASITTLAADTGGESGPLDRATVSDYLDALERLMVVENQPAWAPHLRSRSVLRTSPTRHFTDPSLAVAALRGSPDRLLGDPELFGLLFESMVIRDLRVLAQPLGGEVLHYRDSNGLEVDAIVQLTGGTWAAFEVKLGHSHVDRAAATLTRFAATVNTKTLGPPAALGVITATGYGYRRPDGVSVIPLGALGP